MFVPRAYSQYPDIHLLLRLTIGNCISLFIFAGADGVIHNLDVAEDVENGILLQPESIDKFSTTYISMHEHVS